MQTGPDKSSRAQAKLKDMVVVTYVEDIEQARQYETLLKVNDIPAVVRDGSDSSDEDKCVAVMVPEDYLDEAHVVIESQDAYDDFYDLAEGDEDAMDFDDGMFDDDF